MPTRREDSRGAPRTRVPAVLASAKFPVHSGCRSHSMLRTLDHLRWAVLAVVPATSVGCLCPPCPTGAGPATPAMAEASPAAVGAPVAAGSNLIIWDGEGAGGAAQGWASCDKAPNCKSVLAKESGAGNGPGTGLKLHGEGPGWIGGGWNWVGWYPANGGIDLTGYTHFSFDIRVDPPSSPDLAVDPEALTVALGCSKGTLTSADAPVKRFEKDFADGKWHHVVIPLDAFTKGKGAAFDLKTAWEFRIFEWSATPRNFNIYVDQM